MLFVKIGFHVRTFLVSYLRTFLWRPVMYGSIYYIHMFITCVLLQLYNVVVDTEETGKSLLQKGQLKRRYTIIPLNKIVSRTISNDKERKAVALVRCHTTEGCTWKTNTTPA